MSVTDYRIRVPGDGPVPCALVLLGEYPGVRELELGIPFVGKTGDELTRYLNGYTAPRRDRCYLTNAQKTLPLKPGLFQMSDQDDEELWAELDLVRPTTLVTLGAHVLKYFCGPDATLEAYHGIPHAVTHARLAALGCTHVFPTYNPAATLHSPQLQAWFAYDMRRLGLFLKGQLPSAPVDTTPGVYRRVAATHPDQYTFGRTLAVDTEGWVSDPWCYSYSDTPGYGFVVRQADAGPFNAALRQQKPHLVFHSALHDLAMCRALGCDIDDAGVTFDDTMIMAYLLGLEPQGLKALAYRHAGMRQDDYSEIVAVPNAMLAERWLWALVDTLPDPPKKVKTGRRKKGDPPPPPPPVYSDEHHARAHTKALITRMLAKNEPETLRTRWRACRAREILTEDLGDVLHEWDADPPEATLDEIPEALAVQYAGRDGDCTGRIHPPLRRQITAMGLDDVYQVDLAIVPMIDRMQQVGLGVDLDHFHAVSALLAAEIEVNRDELRRVTKRDLNPNSGDQVATYLFDVLKLDRHPHAAELRIKRTKSGTRLSTNDKILDALSGLDPVVGLIQEGREIRKMKGTYADAIPRLVGRDGRLHPTLRTTRTDTGRLSAADPNVLALPKHSARGRLIREGFIAGPGRVVSEWDLSQIEMCVFAHDAGDERMIAEILSGVDKHAATAAGIFKRPADVIYREHREETGEGGAQRFAAKAVNFGILMGITAFGLLDQMHKNGQLDWSLDRCEQTLAGWLDTYEGGARYITAKHAEARRYGFVRDMFGRLRWLEGVHSTDKYIAAEALRMAQATPIQSGAQGIIKRGMVLFWSILKQMRAEGMDVECLLQVHDALWIEHDPADTEVLDAVVRACLTNAVTLRVPVKVSAKTGKTNLGQL